MIEPTADRVSVSHITDDMVERVEQAWPRTFLDGDTDWRGKLRALIEAALAGCTIDLPAEDQWCHFYGGPDPDNAAGTQLADGEDDARAGSEWVVTLGGKGIARRAVHYGPWEVVDFTPDPGAGGSQVGDQHG